MKKFLLILFFVVLLTSCSEKTIEEEMSDVIGDMVYDVLMNDMTETDFCDKYSEYFDESIDDNIKCAGSQEYYYTLEEMPLEEYNSRSDLEVYYDIEEEEILYWFIFQYEKVKIGYASTDNPMIIIEKGYNWFFDY